MTKFVPFRGDEVEVKITLEDDHTTGIHGMTEWDFAEKIEDATEKECDDIQEYLEKFNLLEEAWDDHCAFELDQYLSERD